MTDETSSYKILLKEDIPLHLIYTIQVICLLHSCLITCIRDPIAALEFGSWFSDPIRDWVYFYLLARSSSSPMSSFPWDQLVINMELLRENLREVTQRTSC